MSDKISLRYLEALDKLSNDDAWRFWESADVASDLTDLEVKEAIRHLREKGLIETMDSAHGGRPDRARVKAAGQDLVHDPDAFATDRALGALARAGISVQHNTTTFTGATIGVQASGGIGHTFSGSVTIVNHPQAETLHQKFDEFEAALAGERTLDDDAKAEINQHVAAVRKELAKPPSEQKQEVLRRRWDRVEHLTAFAAPVLEIAVTIGKLLLGVHGAPTG